MINKVKRGSANKLGILILTITTSLSQFIVYRYIFQNLGKEQMGIWSILVASTSLGLISNFGLSNGLIKYVAEFIGKKDVAAIYRYTGTANAANILFTLPIISLLYFPSKYLGSSVLSPLQSVSFSRVLPWCMFSIFLNNLSSTYICLLDGFQSFFSRSMIQSIGFVVFGISAILLASHLGLIGISIGLSIQSLFVLISSLIVVEKRKYLQFVFPMSLNAEAFKALIGYGLKFQLITILVFIFEPIVKLCLTTFFGLYAVGVYELANKVLVQFRNVVVSLNQVITPAVASINLPKDVNSYMEDSFKSNYWNAVNISILAVCCMPLACYFLTGAIDHVYFTAYIFLSFGWFVNMVCSPFYYSFLGTRKMLYPIIQHCLYALVSVLLFLSFTNHISLNLCFLFPAIAVSSGSAYLIYAGKVYFKFNKALSIITKEKGVYIYMVLIITLLLDQLIFAGKGYISIIALILLIWVIHLYSYDRVRLMLFRLLRVKS